MFVYKTPSEFEEMSEYQKEKYLDEKQKHEARMAEEAAKKAAEEAIEELKKDMQAQREKELEELKASNEKSLEELSKKHSLELDEVKATLNRAKVSEVAERMKGVSEEIIEKLSTPEGEEMLKSFLKGQREKLNVEIESKAIVKPAGSVAPEFAPIVGPGHDDFHARNVIPVFPTISDVINFVQFTVDTEAAGIGTVGEGGQKPSLGYIATAEQAIVRKIAGLLDISDEMLDDVVGLRAWLAYELPKAYLDVEDFQVFKGNGSGTNLVGLWHQADDQTLPFGDVSSLSNNWDKIAAGITEVRSNKRATSAVFVSPVDYMDLLINKDDESAYTYPIIMDANGILRIGGVPIFWSNVFAEDEGLVGDFARGAAIYQRKAMTIAYSDEHSDNFGKNIVTIRIEGRIALPIYHPDAFLKLFGGSE